MKKKFDVIIIGAGIIGAAIARELSKFQLNIAILEKSNDISNGATKANSGIIHGGYDAKSGKLKGYFSRKGNQLFERLNDELNFGFKKNGSLLLAFSEEEKLKLEEIKENGIKNGVDDLKIIDKEELDKLEPNISSEALYALHCPSAGIASPYGACIALIENAIENGVELFLNQEVKNINHNNSQFTITTYGNTYEATKVINCAGVHSDEVSKMVGIDGFHIIPRKGEYLIFQRETGELANHVLFQCPNENGKGVLVTSTVYNNLMIGPNADETDSKFDFDTDIETLNFILDKAKKTLPDLDYKKVIRSFAGLRATSSTGDFIIEETKVPGFINCAGIDSPGLTSSPAIAEYVRDIVFNHTLKKIPKDSFNPYRKTSETILEKDNTKSMQEVLNLTQLEEGNGDRLVCRCEQVSEKTIKDCLDRGIKVTTTDGVKRRTRAGMGACQGRFCEKRVRKLISDYYSIPIEEVTQRGETSSQLLKRIKKSDLK